MRILLTHERFAPDFAGGGEYAVLETARHLILRGHQVKVLTAGDPAITDYEGIETIRLPIHRYRFNFARKIIEDHARDADLIQTFNYHACHPSLYAAKRLGKPVVCQFLALFDDAWLEMKGPLVGRAFRAWEKHLLRLPFDRSIFLSQFSLDIARRLGADMTRAKIIPPGIDLEQYRSDDPKEDIVLFVGKFDVRKGVYDIIEAARQLPDVSFVLYGWGEQEDVLRRQASPNVQVVRFERGEPLRRQFARARIFLFPSRAETFGVAIVEAMASGCAVVSSIPLEFGGAAIPSQDVSAIVREVRALWDNRDASLLAGQRNVERSKRYTWDRNMEDLMQVYDEVRREASSKGI